MFNRCTSRVVLCVSFLFVLLAFFSANVFASPATTNVEISDRAYRDIEKLVAFELCRPPMIDQRPFARGEFARVIAEAKKKFAESELSYDPDQNFEEFSTKMGERHAIERILNRLTKEFEEELIDIGAIEGEKVFVRAHPLEEGRLDAIYLSSAPLNIITDNGVGLVDAVVNPLLHYREGRHATDGYQNALETYHRFKISDHFAFLAHPRFEMNMTRNSGNDYAGAYLQEGYAVLQAGDAALEFGRGSVVWGPGENGGLLITNNARPLDVIKFTTPSPFELPWVFKHLGKFRVTLFGANLGPEQARKYAWLTGYRLSYMPWRYLELGFGNTTQMGGEGMPAMSAADIIGEFLGFRVAGTSAGSVNKTNHIMEASLLIRIPQAWGLQLYGILNNEDKRDTLKRFFRDGSSYLAGLYLPRIGDRALAAFRFEFKRMGPLEYRHGLYTNGYTLDQTFIGDDLGPDALGIHTRFDYDVSEKFSISGIFDWDLRRSDLHVTLIEPDGTLGDIVVSKNMPHENRYRFIAEPNIQVTPNLKLIVDAGYERVINSKYNQGVDVNNWLLALSLKMNFDSKTKFDVK